MQKQVGLQEPRARHCDARVGHCAACPLASPMTLPWQSPYRGSELASFICALILFFTTSAVNFFSSATTPKNQTSRWKVQRDDGVLSSETILTHFSARRRAEQNIDLLAIVQCRCSHVAGDATIIGHYPCCFNNFHCRHQCPLLLSLLVDTMACRCHSPCGNVVCIYAFVLLWQSNPVRNDRYPSQTIRRAAALISPPMVGIDSLRSGRFGLWC